LSQTLCTLLLLKLPDQRKAQSFLKMLLLTAILFPAVRSHFVLLCC